MDRKLKRVSRLRKCPSRLESLLKALRMIPPDPQLMPFKEALGLINIEFPGELGLTREENALKYCLQLLKQKANFLSEFEAYVWQRCQSRYQDQTDAIQDAIDRYEAFRITREKVSWLAQVGQLPVETRREMRALLRSLNIEIDEQGEVQFREDWFTKSVIGVEARRIRECQICGRIFWAGRIGVQGCSPRCLDVLRKRNKRKRDADERRRHDMQVAARSSLNETERRDLVRQALRAAALDQSQIAKQTGLSIDEVDDALTNLILNSREVYSKEKDETRIYFLKPTKKQPVKSQKAKRKRR